MTNEQYLIVSYFTVGAVCFIVAAVVYFWLRGSLGMTLQTFSKKHLAHMLRRLFFAGIILPALVGFFSVTYKSCSRGTYEEIVAERSYLVAKNQEQVAASLRYIIGAVVIWSLIIIAGLCLFRDRSGEKKGSLWP